MHKVNEALLSALLSQPTAPFREVHVIRWAPLGNYHNQGLQGGSECRGPLGPAHNVIA